LFCSIDIPSTSIKNSSQTSINLLLDPTRQTRTVGFITNSG
jgi:hypothetical protein